MNDLVFIAENIYHLKFEYGSRITIGSHATTSNLKTGEKTKVKDEFVIQRAIALPLNMRQQFARSIQSSKEGYLQTGEREFLIDIKDIPAGKSIPKINGYINLRGEYSDITKTEDYEYGIIVIVKRIVGMPSY